MSHLPCVIEPVNSAREAVRNADIVATCTNSLEPVIEGAWLKPGTHVANVQSWEIGPDTYNRVDFVGLVLNRTAPVIAGFIDDDFAIRLNVMSYAAGTPEERARIPIGSWDVQGTQEQVERYPNAQYVDCVNWETDERWQRSTKGAITTLADISFGTREGEAGPSADIQGLQFATIASRIYENARQAGLGQDLPRNMFLQDIPT